MRNKKRLTNVPTKARMADFARWGMAVATALGVEPADFLDALDENSRMVRDEAVHSSPVGVCLLKLVEQEGKEWTCSPAELLKSLREVAPGVGVDEKSLLRNPSWLSRRVKEIAKDLQVEGWIVEMEHSGERRITFRPRDQIRPHVLDVDGEPNKRIPAHSENYEDFSELDTMDTISSAQHSELVPETPPSDDLEGCDYPDGEIEVEL